MAISCAYPFTLPKFLQALRILLTPWDSNDHTSWDCVLTQTQPFPQVFVCEQEDAALEAAPVDGNPDQDMVPEQEDQVEEDGTDLKHKVNKVQRPKHAKNK